MIIGNNLTLEIIAIMVRNSGDWNDFDHGIFSFFKNLKGQASESDYHAV